MKIFGSSRGARRGRGIIGDRPRYHRLQTCSGEVHRTMVVAVIAMRVMKAPVDQIIDMIAVRYGFMPAARTVYMARLMVAAARRTLIRIFRADFDPVLVDMIAVRMMQMAVVEIVDVVAMLDCRVAASRTMLMFMLGVMRLIAGAHTYLLCSSGQARKT
ncbi:hypothetical protein [Burkholderia pseudomultivorans]|uniref:hypothetical protein n=1 Tax=Burkholderia pseudomultivorans TaxID=1207504 RepID=UPI0018C77B03|nr:hypothetical protein [Burkholderia pseudomultivorans]